MKFNNLRKNESGRTTELLIYIAPIAIALGILTGYLSVHSYNEKYKQAETIAISKYGDKKSPLTAEEQKQWYDEMKVEADSDGERNPKKSQLIKFIESNK